MSPMLKSRSTITADPRPGFHRVGESERHRRHPHHCRFFQHAGRGGEGRWSGEILEGNGPFTTFAPTGDAVAALPDGPLEDLLTPENGDRLVAILTYHVVPGKVMSGDLTGNSMAVKTVQGSSVAIAASRVDIDDATATIWPYSSGFAGRI